MDECDFQIRIMSANLRLETIEDGAHNFPYRWPSILKLIERQKPDLICCQEAKPEMLERMRVLLEDYSLCAMPRDLEEEDECPAVFYRKNRLALRGFEVRWLSPTPDVPGSRYPEQSICPRNYHLLRLHFWESKGADFYLLNTHYDHEGPLSRELASRQILDRLKLLDRPFILTGDLNASPDEKAMIELFAATTASGEALLTDCHPNLDFSYHAYHPEREKDRVRIDYILKDASWELLETEVFEQEEGRLLSDHRFIQADLRWRPKRSTQVQGD